MSSPKELSQTTRLAGGGLLGALATSVIYTILRLLDVTFPLVWWIVLFFVVFAVLYLTEWVSAAFLWIAARLGLLEGPDAPDD